MTLLQNLLVNGGWRVKNPIIVLPSPNERTFLAWIRTALALMAGAGRDRPVFSTTFLSFFKALSGVMSCRRWGGTWWAGVASLAA
ncbi:Predicted membrane protein [Salmonella enterica subsp. arizonae]|uniref:Predicted membrane protein n=1 Tax=Salmonella enterica subsp. arizonae TaxID=59203 RepID=A0A379SPH5_SALER|nr:Predicted membrane protein [Salmonella enterica subsp. arizonae]